MINSETFFLRSLSRLVVYCISNAGNPAKFRTITKDKTMNEPIHQSILIICKYHGATNHRGSRVSFRLGIPDSKAHFISYNYELNSIYEMVAHHIEQEFGAVPLWQVQNKDTPSLVYAWDAKLVDFVGLK